jgi:DNA relaxase NicK
MNKSKDKKKLRTKKSIKYINKPVDMSNKDYEKGVPKVYEFEDQLVNENPELSNEINSMGNINDMFSSEVSNPSDVVKELFSGKNPKLRSDLTSEQISIISRLYFLSKSFGMPELEYFLNEFVILRISKDRLSRKEFVEAHRLADESNKKAGIFGNFAGMFGGNR